MYLEQGVWDLYFSHSYLRYLVSKPSGVGLSKEIGSFPSYLRKWTPYSRYMYELVIHPSYISGLTSCCGMNVI